MKFLVPNYSCLQSPWLGGYRPQIPVLSVLNWIFWTPRGQFLDTPLPAPPVIFNPCFRIAIRKVLAYREGLMWSGGRWHSVRTDGLVCRVEMENWKLRKGWKSFVFTNLRHKFFILIHLLLSSTCFGHYCAHLREDNRINTASGIASLFGWLFSTQVNL